MTQAITESAAIDTGARIGSSPRTLDEAIREFFRHASPWIVVVALATAVVARLRVGDWSAWDVLPVALVFVYWPIQEWLIHVFILHFKPVQIGNREIDFRVPRKHRQHHRNPWVISLLFIPLHSFLYSIPLTVLLWFTLMPTPAVFVTMFSRTWNVSVAARTRMAMPIHTPQASARGHCRPIRKREVHFAGPHRRTGPPDVRLHHVERRRDLDDARERFGAVSSRSYRLHLSILPSDSYPHRPGKCPGAVGAGRDSYGPGSRDGAVADRRPGRTVTSLSRPAVWRRTTTGGGGESLCLSPTDSAGR